MEITKLHTLFLECASVSTDTRKIVPNTMFFALKGDNFNGNEYAEQALKKGAKYAVIDEKRFSETPNTILVNNVLKTIQDLATFHRMYLKVPIIALTGSNGKTTTKELINATLSKKHNTTATLGNLNNHIGVPLTLLSMNNDTDIGIIEMGANHLKEIEFLCNIAKPDYGYITNFGKAHLEGFGSIEGVIKGKTELYDYLIENNELIFVNGNDPIQVEKSSKAKAFTFGNDPNHFNVALNFVEANPNVKVSYHNHIIQSHLIGAYNFSNISAAIAIGNFFKVNDDDIKTAIEDYIPTNNRSQVIKKSSNQIILDAYNANPTSMAAALMNFEKLSNKNKIVILGDMFELGKEAAKEHQNITDLLISLKFQNIILIGENFFKIKTTSPRIIKFRTFEDFKTTFKFSEIKDSTLLIKGSRGMALERTLDLL